MIIEERVEQALIPKQLVKPKILLDDDWEWEWVAHSPGIMKNEGKELKHFLKNSTPILGYLNQEIRRLTKVMQRNRNLVLRDLEENAYTPFIRLLYSSKQKNFANVHFILEFTWDGAIFVDREEDIKIPSGERTIGGKKVQTYYSSPIHLRWPLGELYTKEK